MRSYKSFRGIITTGSPPQSYAYESNGEAQFAKVALTNRAVRKLEEQPQAVSFIDEDDRRRQHVLDFRVTTVEGTTIGYAVKPEMRAKRFTPFLERLAAQTDPDFAQSIKHISERHLDPISVANAKLILWARRRPITADDETVRSLISDLEGSTTIESLVAESGLKGNGFRAIVRLIDLGELVPMVHARIDYPMPVRKERG